MVLWVGNNMNEVTVHWKIQCRGLRDEKKQSSNLYFNTLHLESTVVSYLSRGSRQP